LLLLSAVVIVVLVLSLVETSAWSTMVAAAVCSGDRLIAVLVLSLVEAPAWLTMAAAAVCSGDRRAGALLGGGIGLVSDGCCCRPQWVVIVVLVLSLWWRHRLG
jgi:hypothetical protein